MHGRILQPIDELYRDLDALAGDDARDLEQEHGIPRKTRSDAVDIYLTTGFIPSPLSIYEDVYKLEARQSLVFDLASKRIVDKHYHYTIPKYSPIYNKKELIREARSLLKDATRLRLISDVPVGAFLSGGLDSSTVVATMAEFTDLKKLHTFSIGFEGAYDESRYMKIVKDRFKTRHHHKYYHEADFERMLDRISYYYDEPFGDYSNFPTYEVSRLARQYVTVALSGDGGDEIFGGYTFHKIVPQVELLKKSPKALRRLGMHLIPKTTSPMTLIGGVREALKMSLTAKEKFYSSVGDDFVYKPSAFRKWSEERMTEMLNSCGGNMREAIIRFDLFYNTLADNFLVKVDRAAMANSLEVRAPFLDYRFVELEANIPVECKANARQSKILMRKVIKGIVPDEIVNRGKKGFHPPIDKWIMKPARRKELEKGVEELYNKGIISREWHDFYTMKSMRGDDLIYRNYNIRMLLLIKWCGKWLA